jgi:hypothetical protein
LKEGYFQGGFRLNHFDPQDDEQDESVQIVDLDAPDSSQKRRADFIRKISGWIFLKPWRGYTLLTFLLLILIGNIFLQYHPLAPTNSTRSSVHADGAITPLTPTSAPPALLKLQSRPLHIPTIASGQNCPTTAKKRIDTNYGIVQGDGPVYPIMGADNTQSPAIFRYVRANNTTFNSRMSAGWGGQKVLWIINPHYRGLVLVRGKQLNGTHTINFYDIDNNQPFTQQLVLDTLLGGDSLWPNFSSYTLIQTPGCYAYQVDGTNFSYVIIFLAMEHD